MKKQILILILACTLVCGLLATSESGPLAPTPFFGIHKAGPVANSKMFVLEARVINGKAQVELPIDTPRNAMTVVLGESSVRAVTGGQIGLEPLVIRDKELKRMNMPSGNTRFNLSVLPAGRQVIFLEGLKNKKNVKLVVAQPHTPLSLAVQVLPLAARAGESVKVTARLEDVSSPYGVHIEAALSSGSFFKLNDNGLNGDVKADDGIYTGSFTAPAVKGFKGINIRFSAQGNRSNGDRFLRNAISSVMVTNPKSALLKEKITATLSAITVPVKACEGRFRVEAIFAVKGTTLAYSRENIVMTGQSAIVGLPLPAAAKAADRAVIKLLNIDNLGLEDEVEISLTPGSPLPKFQAPKDAPLPASKVRALQLLKKREQQK